VNSNFQAIEEGFGQLGESRSLHECLIRTICEVAETPLSGDGIIGDVFNLLLSPISDVKVGRSS
jgi:hypothetical protein